MKQILIGNLPSGTVFPDWAIAITIRYRFLDMKYWGVNIVGAMKESAKAGINIITVLKALELHELSHVCEDGLTMHSPEDTDRLKSNIVWNIKIANALRSRKLKRVCMSEMIKLHRRAMIEGGLPNTFTYPDIVIQDARRKGLL